MNAGNAFEKHVPSLLIAVVVGLMSWFGKSVVESKEEAAKFSAQITEVAGMVVELRHDQKTSLSQVGAVGEQIRGLDRRVSNVESLVVYRNAVDPMTPAQPHK